MSRRLPTSHPAPPTRLQGVSTSTKIDPMTTRHARISTSLGELTAVVDDARDGGGAALIGLYFPGHWTLPNGADHGPRVDVAYELRGGSHHQQVWALLERIPYGQTVTYGDLAAATGGAAQAVGRAVGANPISIVVPCHRVIGADGSITGYAGGLDRKRALLALEEPSASERGALF